MTKAQIFVILHKHTDMWSGGARRAGRWNSCRCGTKFPTGGNLPYYEHLADVLAAEMIACGVCDCFGYDPDDPRIGPRK